MAFDFPNSPSVGQRVTGVGGIVYVWDGVKWASNIGSVTAQSMGDVGRNLLHNPLFNVAQRGGGPFTLVGFTADRWGQTFVGGTLSTFVVALTDADRAAIGDESAQSTIQVTSAATAGAGDLDAFLQDIENVRRLAGKTVTVSFWARALAGTPKLGINILQFFGTGGSPSASVWATAQTITLSTTWTRYTQTFSLASVAGKTFGSTAGTDYTGLYFWLSCGATNAVNAGNPGVQSFTLYLWGVQLEIGSVATPLDKPYDYGADLRNCQRFFQAGVAIVAGGNTGSGGTMYASNSLVVTMRAIPTSVTTSDTSGGAINPRTVLPSTPTFVSVSAPSNAANASWAFNMLLNLSADL